VQFAAAITGAAGARITMPATCKPIEVRPSIQLPGNNLIAAAPTLGKGLAANSVPCRSKARANGRSFRIRIYSR
jgi:hypothetical protein